MPDIQGLISDPDFETLTAEEKRSLLQKFGAPQGFIEELLAVDSGTPEKQGFFDTLQGAIRQGVQAKIPGILADVLPGGGLAKDPLTGVASIEQGLENLPAVGGALGGLVGALPGGAAGAGLGEAVRQGARRLAGLPSATGVVQRFMELDPDSPGAAVASLAAETAAGPVATAATKILGVTSKAVDKSALRSLIHLLQPDTKWEWDNSLKIARKLRDAGIALPGSSRESQIARAEAALAKSSADLDTIKAPLVAAGADLPTQNIHDKVFTAIPEVLPSGNVPLTGAAERKAAENAAYDVLDATGAEVRVPLDIARSEKERTDRVLRRFYNSGALNVPAGVEFTKNAADAWRKAIHDQFPKLGTALTDKSELISVTEMLKDALKKTETRGTSAAQAAAAIGSAGTGGWRIPGIELVKSFIESGPIASLSASGKGLMRDILGAGAETAQAWIRLADQFNLGQAQEEENFPSPKAERPEDLNLKELAKSILEKRAAAPTVSEEEFIRRYQ